MTIVMMAMMMMMITVMTMMTREGILYDLALVMCNETLFPVAKMQVFIIIRMDDKEIIVITDVTNHRHCHHQCHHQCHDQSHNRQHQCYHLCPTFRQCWQS